MQEMTSGVSTALKSWLAFGASITGNKSKSVASVARESVSEGPAPATSRLRVMFRQGVYYNEHNHALIISNIR